MDFKYYIDLKCPLQSGRPPAQFLQRTDLGSVLEQAVEDWRESSGSRTGEPGDHVTIHLPYKQTTLYGSRNEWTYGELKQEQNRLYRKASEYCNDCDSRVSERIFGCSGKISYPVSPSAEEWLIENMQIFNGLVMGYVAHQITERNITGEWLDRTRNGGRSDHPEDLQLIFKAPRALERVVEDRTWSSSQILEYLFSCEPVINPITCLGLATDFQIVKIDTETSSLLNAWLYSRNLGDPFDLDITALEDLEICIHFEDDEDPSLTQLKIFLIACWVAFLAGVNLRIYPGIRQQRGTT
jgi:hypothetical protein